MWLVMLLTSSHHKADGCIAVPSCSASAQHFERVLCSMCVVYGYDKMLNTIELIGA